MMMISCRASFIIRATSSASVSSLSGSLSGSTLAGLSTSTLARAHSKFSLPPRISSRARKLLFGSIFCGAVMPLASSRFCSASRCAASSTSACSGAGGEVEPLEPVDPPEPEPPEPDAPEADPPTPDLPEPKPADPPAPSVSRFPAACTPEPGGVPAGPGAASFGLASASTG
ncbi:hypothetical protein OJJOAM_004891 [Cupriavidus sp. H18C1]|uniref:hypothetical protein n=1 Tax=Cupriavidus sp. H18C1 TaxID=3241601 RepID=UPI003BB8A0B4